MTYQAQRGFSIIELMVTLLITATILAGVAQLYATSTRNSIGFEGAARIQENARYVFGRMGDDIIQAGSGGCLGLTNAVALSRLVNVLGVNAAKNEKYDLASYVSGVENTGANKSDQLTLRYSDRSARIPVKAYKPGTGKMLLDDTDPDFSDLKQYQVVYAGNCSRTAAFMITNTPAGGNIEFAVDEVATSGPNKGQKNKSLELGFASSFSASDPNTVTSDSSLAYLYGGDSIIEYKIDDSAAGVCASSSPQNCALFRNDIEIVEGVERFDVEYGWKTPAGHLIYGNWNAVMTENARHLINQIKVTATFNSVERSPSVDGGDYLSKTLSRVFMIRNRLPTY